MGMSASQARYLGLIARQSNLEYQGQQINQERTVLSQQSTALYNSLLAMEVPTPPSTNDFTTVEYSGSDGATNFTLGNIKPSADGQSYIVEKRTSQVGDALQQRYSTATVVRGEESYTGSYVDPSVATNVITSIAGYYVKDENTGEWRTATESDFDTVEGGYKLSSGKEYFLQGAGEDKITMKNDGAYTVYGETAYTFQEAKAKYPSLGWGGYEQAIKNSFGGNYDVDDFMVFFTTSDSGAVVPYFSLAEDVQGSDNKAVVYEYIANGQYTFTESIEGCKLEFDTSGRIQTLQQPIKDSEGNIIGYTDISLEAATVTDELAYQDAYAQYEYAQYQYDKTQQEINAKTEIIQQEDRNLELKLQRLDNERTQITTEIEAVSKVIDDNIEASYKTFSG